MYITLEIDYAIRIVDFIARENDLAGASAIAEKTGIPLRFAKNILQKLVKARIINSYMGIYGGYELAKDKKNISLYDIIEVIDGPINLNRCLLEDEVCTCVPDKQCPYRDLFRNLSREMEAKLRRINFASTISGWKKYNKDTNV